MLITRIPENEDTLSASKETAVMILTADCCVASDCAGFVLVLLLVMVDLDITGRLLIGMGQKP